MYTPQAMRFIGKYLALPLAPLSVSSSGSMSSTFRKVVLHLLSCASMLRVTERVGHAIGQHHESKDDRDNFVTETPEQYLINTMLAVVDIAA
jgi:hypothetical protein